MIKIKDLFSISNGNGLALSSLKLNPNGINFISRQEKNNGIAGSVEKIKNINPFKPGCLTVALSGSVLETFLQEEEFYTAYHIKVLEPKFKLTKRELLFYCAAIKRNNYRYNFGRQANKTLDELLIPDLNELPEWFKNIDIPDEIGKSSFSDEKIELNIDNWEYFNLYPDYFEMVTGKYYRKGSYGDGKVALISSSDSQNGVMSFTDLNSDMSNCLTIGKVKASTFYQENKFLSTSDVTTLKPNFEMNSFIAMFLCTVINLENKKWTYGRQIRLNDSKKIKIKLPSTNKGEPDWNYMENFIKTLKYSSNLKT